MPVMMPQWWIHIGGGTMGGRTGGHLPPPTFRSRGHRPLPKIPAILHHRLAKFTPIYDITNRYSKLVKAAQINLENRQFCMFSTIYLLETAVAATSDLWTSKKWTWPTKFARAPREYQYFAPPPNRTPPMIQGDFSSKSKFQTIGKSFTASIAGWQYRKCTYEHKKSTVDRLI